MNFSHEILKNIDNEFYKHLTHELEKIDNRYCCIEKNAGELLERLDESVSLAVGESIGCNICSGVMKCQTWH